MRRIVASLLTGFILFPGTSLAVCKLMRGQPTVLSITTKTIHINADAPADVTKPIATFDSNINPARVGYDLCENGTQYGKDVIGLYNQDAATRIYPTNIPGIGVKVLWNNGIVPVFGQFPSQDTLAVSPPAIYSQLDFREGAFYRIEFYKTRDYIKLNNPQGDLVLPAGEIAYNYIMSNSPTSFGLKLRIGNMMVTSTPTCTTDTIKNINFNNVTPSLLKEGVVRPLDFNITCKSDYGAYSAKASIYTQTPSADGSYILVRDSAGNNDRLGIKITDSEGHNMRIDGSSSESKNNIVSQGPATFNWKATLIPVGIPSGGAFSAKAEIIFNIN